MGQRSKPHLTKQGKKILCKTENFVPLVVPGTSSTSGTSSSSTSLPQDSSSTSSSPTAIHQKPQNKNRKRDTEFTENLEDTEMPAPAHISQDSDSERPAKVVTKSTKHRIYTHFPKDRNCEVCLRNKMTRAPCRRRTGEAPPRAEKFGDLKTTDHKVLNEEGESRNKHRYAVLVQDLATQWIQSYLSKTKTSQGTDKSLKIVPRQMVLLRVRHAE